MSEQIVNIDTENEYLLEKMPHNIEIITEKRERGHRGPDKISRKFNPVSLQNLKQNQKNTEKTPNLGTKLWRWLGIIILIIVMVIIIWKICEHLTKNYLR